jgi:hypothetical protein
LRLTASFQIRQEDGKQRQEAKHTAENDDSNGVDLGKFVFGSVGQHFGHKYFSVKKIPSSQQAWMATWENTVPSLANRIFIEAGNQ